jgi:hypothetical protein
MDLLNWIIARPAETFFIWLFFVFGVAHIIKAVRK